MSVDVTALSIKVESIGIREASNALGGLSTSANNADKRIKSLTAAMSALNAASLSTASVKSLAGALNTVAASVGAVANANNGLKNSNVSQTLLQQKRDMEAYNLAAKQYAQAHAEAVKMNKALDKAAKEAADGGLKRNNAAMREAHGLARGLSGSLGALWMTYGNFAGMAVGIGIGATLKGIVSIGKDVEHTLEGIRVRGGETTKSMDQMRESLFNLSKGVYGPEQVAKAFETLVLAGLKADQALSSINAAMNLAVVGGTTIEQAATTLVSVGTAVGYTAEGFDRVGDVIAKTAALSMSSVETLSEAFKSGSSVNKLYGVSLEDIGTNLGVLSNLGIQGSAAGTAMKNFYKELAAGSDKVVSTLKAMKMSSKDFKNAEGDFLPVLDVVEKLAKGLKGLEIDQQKLAIANLTNERGMRLAVQLLGEYNTKTGESSNALKEFRKNVEDSYGFAAIGAVAMSLTAKSQLESMMNTLKTTFAETFTELQPEVIAFSSRMKEIFGSEEFKDGVRKLAQTFANLAIAIANNLPLITNLLLAFTAVKVLIAGGAMWTAAATGIASVGAAFRLAAAGALTFQAALGPVALVLAAVAVALVLYNNAQEDSNKHTKAATDYSKGYLEGLKEEEIRLGKVNAKLREKMSLDDANKAIERGEAKDKMITLNNKAIAEAENNLSNGIKWTGYTRLAQEKELAKARQKAITDLAAVEAAEVRIKKVAKENADIVKANAAANRVTEGGDGTLGGKPDKAGINDAYQAEILKQMAEIKAAKKDMAAFEEREFLRFKTGEIGKLKFLENIGNEEVATHKRIKAALEANLKVAGDKRDKSEVQRYNDEIEQNDQNLANRQKSIAQERELQITKYVEEYSRQRADAAEAAGNYSQAATDRFEAQHGKTFAQAKKDLETYGDQYPILQQVVDAFTAKQKEMVQDGVMKEVLVEYDKVASTLANKIKGIQTASEGQGLAAMWTSANDAAKLYQASLEDLRIAEEAIKNAGNSDKDEVKYQEALANSKRLAENIKTMWAGVGESISNSLSSAFGNAGKAAGDLMMVAVKTGQTEATLADQKKAKLESTAANYKEFGRSQYETTMALNKITMDFASKERSVRVKAYGDMAGAAKGFFKEGSTGYKVLEGAEKAFRVLELAGMIKSVATTVTTEGAKNTAKVPGVFMSFMSALGPWGLAAAGVAIAAVLGGAFSNKGAGTSSKEVQESQGKGSVFGDSDARSESISNSLEILEKNSGLGLVHSNGMLHSLRNIEASMTGLSNLVFRTPGVMDASNMGIATGTTNTGDWLTNFMTKTGKILPGVAGEIAGGLGEKIAKLWGGTKTQIVDSGLQFGGRVGDLQKGTGFDQYASVDTTVKKYFGISKKVTNSLETDKLDNELSQQFGLIFSNLGDALASAAKTMGQDGKALGAAVSDMVLETTTLSLKDLKGEELQEAINGVVNKAIDDIAERAFPGLDKFRMVGEGYFETLARLSNSLEQVKDVFAVMGQSMSTTGMEAIEVSQSLITAAGGLDTLTSGTKFFVDNFLTEAEKMGPITKSVTDRLKELGSSELTSIELYKDKVRSLDLNNTAEHELYTNLLELAPAFKESADYATKLADGTTELTKAEKKAKDIADKQRELDIRLMEASGNSLGAIAARRNDELEALTKLSPALAVTQKALYDLEDAASTFTKQRSLESRLMTALGDTAGALAMSREDEVAALKKTHPALVHWLEAIYKAEDATKASTLSLEKQAKVNSEAKGNLEAAYQKETTAMQGVIDKFKTFAENLKKFKQSLMAGDLSTLSPEQKYLQAKSQFTTTSSLAATGDEAAIGELENISQTFLDASRGYYASTDKYAEDYNSVQKALTDGINAAEIEVNIAQSQLDTMKKQYERLVGIENNTKGFPEALAAYLNTSGGANASKIGDVYQSSLGRDPDKAGMEFWQGKLDKGASIGDVTKEIQQSPEAAVRQLYQTILKRNPDSAGLTYWVEQMNKGVSFAEVQKAILSSSEINGSHYNGLDAVPYDGYVAEMHKGERIQTAKAANASDENSAELVSLTKQLLTKIAEMKDDTGASVSQRAAIAEQTSVQLAELARKMEDVKRAVRATP